jgi:hypothetical protein
VTLHYVNLDITPRTSRDTRIRPGRGTGAAGPPEDRNAVRSVPYTPGPRRRICPARSRCTGSPRLRGLVRQTVSCIDTRSDLCLICNEARAALHNGELCGGSRAKS